MNKVHKYVGLLLFCVIVDLDGVGDVMNLFGVIVYVDKEMSEIFSATFERELSTLQSPDVVMSDLVQQIHTEMDSEVNH